MDTFPNLTTVPRDRRHVFTDPVRIEYVRAARYAAESLHALQAGAVYQWDASDAAACRLPTLPVVTAERTELTSRVLSALSDRRDTDRAFRVRNPFTLDPKMTYAAKRLAALYLRAYRRGEMDSLDSPHIGKPWPKLAAATEPAAKGC